MPQVINTNLASLNAQRMLNGSQASLQTSLQRLSSGLRVNSAKDDAAGLAIAEKMTSQVRGMNVAVRNANDGISLAQTGEAALGKMGDMLQRMRELGVQSRNATNSTTDREALQKEFTELQKEISRVTQSTNFNGTNLFTSQTNLVFQIGANTTTNDKITISGVKFDGTTVSTASVSALVSAGSTTADAAVMGAAFGIAKGSTTGIAIGGNVSTSTGRVASVGDIDKAINMIDKALAVVNDKRAKFGAVQNRFDAVISTLQVNVENTMASRSRITDADFAAETANLTRSQILQQSGVAMLAQANSAPQGVLSLLR